MWSSYFVALFGVIVSRCGGRHLPVVLASHVVPFLSARRGIASPSVAPSSSHRHFSHPACLSIPSISEPIGMCRLCGRSSRPSARLSARAIASCSHPPRLIDTVSGENDGASFACLRGRSRSRRVRLPLRLRRDGMEVISFCILSLLIACPSSYDCRAILGRAMRVVMGSGLGLVRLLPRLFRIPCGFVSFRSFPAPSPRAASSGRLIRAHPIPFRFVPSYPPNPFDRFVPIVLIAITPRLSCRGKRGGFYKRIEFDAFENGTAERLLPTACLPSYGCSMPPVGSSHHLIEYASPSPAYRRPNPITL